MKTLDLDDNPLNPALQSAYDACKPPNYEPLWAYIRSLEQNAEPLYEAKLVLVGEGNVGKTTLKKALQGKTGEEAPKKDERTTHGVEIDIDGLRLPHPEKDGVEIQLNAWDFGGQDVYRVTHQFFFSRRSLYLLVWEPRNNVQQGRLDEWLDMIRLRVGDDARVLIVSTHCKTGERIARIDKPVFKGQYGDMIVGFYEVDSLVPDPDGTTGEMTGIAELKRAIAPGKQPGQGHDAQSVAHHDGHQHGQQAGADQFFLGLAGADIDHPPVIGLLRACPDFLVAELDAAFLDDVESSAADGADQHGAEHPGPSLL